MMWSGTENPRLLAISAIGLVAGRQAVEDEALASLRVKDVQAAEAAETAHQRIDHPLCQGAGDHGIDAADRRRRGHK